MKLLKRQYNLAWLPQPNEVHFIISSEMPPVALCSSAYVFAFDGDKLLMADLDRGMDIPGGHIDSGELPEVAMRREAFEETGAIIGPARLWGYQKIILKGPKPEGYKYPYPESYQVMYFSSEFRMGKFVADTDSRGSVLITKDQAKNVHWLRENREIYDYAVSLLALNQIKPKPKP